MSTFNHTVQADRDKRRRKVIVSTFNRFKRICGKRDEE